MKFETIEKVHVSGVELEEFMNITDWYMYDTLLICKNGGRTPCYYVLNTSDFHVMASVGKIGKGHDEWIAPHLMVDKDGERYLLDNGKRALYRLTGMDGMDKISNVDLFLPPNDTRMLSYPIYAYVTYSPRAVSLYIGNVETSDTLSSLSFCDAGGKAIKYEFSYDISDKGEIVLAHRLIDKFMIVSIAESKKLYTKYIIEGDGYVDNSDNRYYTDVVCDDYIYLLSQRSGNGKETGKTSQIEVYDYTGNPVKRIELDIYALRMLKDNKRKRMYLLTPSSEDIHILDLHDKSGV